MIGWSDLKTAWHTLQAARGVKREVDQLPLRQREIDLQRELETTVGQVRQLSDRVAELERENAALRALLDERAAMHFEGGAYWREPAQEGGVRDGPFCPQCWDDESKVIRLHDRPQGITLCTKCKYNMRTPGYTAPPRRQSPPRRGGWVNGWRDNY